MAGVAAAAGVVVAAVTFATAVVVEGDDLDDVGDKDDNERAVVVVVTAARSTTLTKKKAAITSSCTSRSDDDVVVDTGRKSRSADDTIIIVVSLKPASFIRNVVLSLLLIICIKCQRVAFCCLFGTTVVPKLLRDGCCAAYSISSQPTSHLTYCCVITMMAGGWLQKIRRSIDGLPSNRNVTGCMLAGQRLTRAVVAAIVAGCRCG